MKYAGSGSPIASTTSRRTMKPSKATFSSSTTLAASAARSAYGRLDHRALGPDRQRVAQVEARSRPSRPACPAGPRAPPSGRPRRSAISTARQSGAGHDVVVHQPDPVEARVVRRPHAEVEAAGAAEVLRRCGSPASGRSVARRRAPRGCGRCWRCRRRYTASGRRGLGGQPVEHPARAGRRGCRSRRRPRRSRCRAHREEPLVAGEVAAQRRRRIAPGAQPQPAGSRAGERCRTTPS